MKDAKDNVVYVGKAKNLRQRLNNYRVANPDRMPRRHLRMVREVKRIEFQFCTNESSALAREAKLLRAIKPKFNRAGIWPGKTWFIVWRVKGEQIELSVAETPEPGWQRFGPMGSSAVHLHHTLTRLLWWAVNQNSGTTQLPTGWVQGRFMNVAAIQCGDQIGDVVRLVDSFFWQGPEPLLSWFGTTFAGRAGKFERGLIQAELEILSEFALKHWTGLHDRQQLALV